MKQTVSFTVNGQNHTVTVKGEKEAINMVFRAIAIMKDLEELERQDNEKNTELANSFLKQFRKADEVRELEDKPKTEDDV